MTGELHLTARDAHWLHAHWALPPVIQSLMMNTWERQNLAVRLHKGRVAGQAFREIQPQPGARECFLQVEEAGTPYVAELFWWDSQGRWVCLATSNTATTPPELVSEDRSTLWVELPGQVATQAAERGEAGPAEARVSVREDSSGTPGFVEAAPPVVPGQPLAPLETSPLEVSVAQMIKAVQVPNEDQLGARIEPGFHPIETCPATFQRPLRSGLPSHGSPKTEIPMDFALSVQGPSSLETGLPSAVASQRGQPGADVAGLDQAAHLPYSPVSSVEMQVAGLPAVGPRRRGFWFKINAELIIYGATEPDAHLFIGDRRVRLRPDGSFSYHFALPDGSYSLPVEAWSVQGDDCRKADLAFSRLTKIEGEVGAHPQDAALRPPAVQNV